MKSLSKVKHQIKSGKYYIFWGACTIAVMAGQIYVGAGYRSMSQEVKDLTEMVEIKIEMDLSLWVKWPVLLRFICTITNHCIRVTIILL